MSQVTICPYCKQVYEKPVLIHCGHSICYNCAKQLYNKETYELICPVCHNITKISSLRLLQLNKDLNEICIKLQKYTQKHQGGAQAQMVGSQSLTSLNDAYQFIDTQTNRLLTSKQALLLASRGIGQIQSIDEQSEQLLFQFRDANKQLQNNAQKVRKLRQLVDQCLQSMQESVDRSLKKADQYFSGLISLIKQRQKEIHSSIESEHQVKRAELEQFAAQLDQIKERQQQFSQVNPNSFDQQQLCSNYIVLQQTNQIQQDASFPTPILFDFVQNDVVEQQAICFGGHIQVQDLTKLLNKYQIELSLQSGYQVYDFSRPRQIGDASMLAENVMKDITGSFLKTVDTAKQQRQLLGRQLVQAQQFLHIHAPEGSSLSPHDQEAQALVITMQLQKLVNIPQEFFTLINQYFGQIINKYEKYQDIYDRQLEYLSAISEQCKLQSLVIEGSDLCKLQGILTGIFAVLGRSYNKVKQIIAKQTKQCQEKYSQIHQQFQEIVMTYEQKKTQIRSLSGEVDLLNQKLSCEMSNISQNSGLKQNNPYISNDTAKSQSLKLKQLEQNYLIKQQELKAQISSFLTYELNIRKHIQQLTTDLLGLKNQQTIDNQIINQIFCGQITQFSQDLSKAIFDIQKQDYKSQLGQNMDVFEMRIIYNIVLEELKSGSKSELQKQIEPLILNETCDNVSINTSFQVTMQDNNRSMLEDAPENAIGICTALYDYDPKYDEENAGNDEILPLRQGYAYWLYQYDPEGWSVVSNKQYPNIRQLAPSNYLELDSTANTKYKFQESMLLRQCGGSVGTAASGAIAKQNSRQVGGKTASESVSSMRIVTAQYDFEGEDSDDLQFNQGDKITIVDVLDGEEWYRGTNLRTGKIGVYPAVYVK